MIRKPLELPPAVARGFVSAMNDYFAESDNTKRDAITAHQLSVLNQSRGQREKPLQANTADCGLILRLEDAPPHGTWNMIT
jgi:hypothetical protein